MLPSVLILAPCYVSSYGPARDSVGNFMAVYAEEGGKVRIKSGWRSSSIVEVRTLCVSHHAIPSDFDMVLWVDDDNCFSPDDAKTIVREAHERKSIVGALYRMRSEQEKLIRGPIDFSGGNSETIIQSVNWVGFGLTAMPMPLLRTMWEKYGQDMFRDTRSSSGVTDPAELAALKGDDSAFCRNWRLLGHKVYVHNGVKIGHIGPTIFRVES